MRQTVHAKRLARYSKDVFGPVYNAELRPFERRENDEPFYRLHGKPNILYIFHEPIEWNGFGQALRADNNIFRVSIERCVHK